MLSSYKTLCKEMVNFKKYKLPEKYHHLNYDFLHVSDGKFLYALTQHSLFNRLFHPYLLCRCGRMESATNTCTRLTDEEYETLQKKSEIKLRLTLTNDYNNKSLNELSDSEFLNLMNKHRIWCDTDNYGITHFGINNKFMKISDVRFDILHLKLSVTRKIITFICDFLITKSYKNQQRFSTILKQKWGKFYVDCYESYKNLNVIHGIHVNEFIQELTPDIVKFIKKHLENTKVTRSLIVLLNEWREISRIMNITYIENNEDYLNTIKVFETKIQHFKKAAKYTIYSATSGNDNLEEKKENFYCHVLTEYLVPIMKQTYNKYGLGIGIFSMQGMERRNKESKNCAKRFYNNRYNICISTLLQLFDLFFHGNVLAEHSKQKYLTYN